MTKAESIKRDIDLLPKEVLDDVARYVRSFRIRKRKTPSKIGLLDELALKAIDDDLPVDLAEQHDHYLYGSPKR